MSDWEVAQAMVQRESESKKAEMEKIETSSEEKPTCYRIKYAGKWWIMSRIDPGQVTPSWVERGWWVGIGGWGINSFDLLEAATAWESSSNQEEEGPGWGKTFNRNADFLIPGRRVNSSGSDSASSLLVFGKEETDE